MYEKIRYKENRIVLILSYVEFDGRAVFFDDHTVKRKRDGDPLIFLDAAVIMRIKICYGAVLVQRIGLDIKPRGIYMGTEDVHAFRKRSFPDVEQSDGFVHVHRINLITLL